MPPAEQSALWHSLERSDSAGWMHFVPDAGPTVEEFWSRYAPESFMGDEDDIKLIREETDELGITHRRYQQMYRGFPVRGAEIMLTSREEYIYSAHGNWVKKQNIPHLLNITEEEALNQALSKINADQYVWEDQAYVERWKELHQSPEDSPFPEGELMIHRKYEQIQEGDVSEMHGLTWYFEIQALSPAEAWGLWIDAGTGELFEKRSLVRQCSGGVLGTCNTLYNGTKNIWIRQRNPNSFELKDCDRNIEVDDPSDTFDGAPRHSSTNWGNVEQAQTTVLWAAQQMWDYMDTQHNYEGTHDDGSTYLLIHANASQSGAGYFDMEIFIRIGVNDLGNFQTTVDVVGHEYMHGIDHARADLDNVREPGAIGEGYSDIFGTLAERYVDAQFSSGWNWTIAEDAGTIERNIQNPLATQNPNVRWGGHYFHPSATNCPTPDPNPFSAGGNDNCGVHRNSTLTSLAFYLLAQGGNQNGGIVVPAIGMDKAAKIAFRALKYKLMTSSGFNDARNAWIQSASELYGTCSWEEFACKRAWAAVGIGSSPSSFCVEISGPTTACYDSYTFPTYTARSIAGASHSWSVPAGWTVQFSGSGNKTMTVTNIATWSYSNAIIDVWTNGNGMYAGDTHYVTVSNCYQYRHGIDSQAWIKFYPQPASDYIEIEANPALLPASCIITDMMGRDVHKVELETAQTKISTHSLATGIYTCQVRSSQGQVISQTLQINK